MVSALFLGPGCCGDFGVGLTYIVAPVIDAGLIFLSNSTPTWNLTRTNFNKLEQVRVGVGLYFHMSPHCPRYKKLETTNLALPLVAS